jgi:hypothetical protein
LEYKTKPIFDALGASEARTPVALMAANKNPDSEAATKNERSMVPPS